MSGQNKWVEVFPSDRGMFKGLMICPLGYVLGSMSKGVCLGKRPGGMFKKVEGKSKGVVPGM